MTEEAGVWAEAEALRQLGRFGITSLSVLEAPGKVALLVQGWAFDADASGERVVEIVTPGASDVTVFHPVVQVGVTSRVKGDSDEEAGDEIPQELHPGGTGLG
ncbi:MAG: hypothetical protein WD269_09230 [Acidimicrobiia bacterium]